MTDRSLRDTKRKWCQLLSDLIQKCRVVSMQDTEAAWANNTGCGTAITAVRQKVEGSGDPHLLLPRLGSQGRRGRRGHRMDWSWQWRRVERRRVSPRLSVNG